jgi:hypothetical protein
MSSNKRVREELERLYGKECFIEKLHLRKDTEPRKYTSKGQMEKMKRLTFHHILEKRNNGQATVENGALLSNENHIWFHKQSEHKQGYMNAIFQEYKRQVDECKNECKVVFVDDLKVPYEVKATEFILDEKNKGKYNRAREKEKLRKMSEEYVDR